ncbi:type II toxin-antitoxin system HigB family toxin [Hymenobacter sp. BT664]|uniref:Type II toxin-antitoxin system HigB family toxin n=1 Tax=Hymenobacter montanus TaxID=2771359 RepID=A0A927BGK0_9BACT|nr:type II toxin-antitoxin system HigB family toxin [Hymenobacter montanus]MBD2769664.1 type II toxin-antitoxin system HigB family toxin [Hymenobacter montanus]
MTFLPSRSGNTRCEQEAADWGNLNEVKENTLSSHYIIYNRYVFNIKGNRYQLVAMIFFFTKQVYIRGIFTHAEYSKLSKRQLSEL